MIDWNVQSHPGWPRGRGAGLEGRSVTSGRGGNQSSLCSRASVKPKEAGFGALSGRRTGGGGTGRQRGRALALGSPSLWQSGVTLW